VDEAVLMKFLLSLGCFSSSKKLRSEDQTHLFPSSLVGSGIGKISTPLILQTTPTWWDDFLTDFFHTSKNSKKGVYYKP
jgi:hypothetical protein